MQLRLTYSEVENMISEKTGKELPMCFGGPHSIRISYKVPLMGAVGLDITVEGVRGSDIILSFGGGAGIEFMLRTAINQAKKQHPEVDNMVELMDNSQLLLSLGKNPNLAAVLANVTLQDIHFDEQAIMIDFVPKV